jgi:hypothetical protein
LERALAGRSDGSERSHVGWIPRGFASGYREMGMLGLESVPHRIGEEVFGEIVHCYGKAPVGVLM